MRRSPSLYWRAYGGYKRLTDADEFRYCRSVLTRGANVVDIGAYIGIYTAFFLREVGQGGEVHAFEPDPYNFQLCQRFVPSASNLFLENSAVGAESGQITFYRSGSLSVDHRCYAAGDDSREAIQRPIVRLDDYWPSGKPLSLIKMDIQGYEYYALQGMQRVLRDNPCAPVLFEWYPHGIQAAGSAPQEVVDWLRQQHRDLLILEKGKLTPLPDHWLRADDPHAYCNVVAQ